jgi:hypothetical protein
MAHSTRPAACKNRQADQSRQRDANDAQRLYEGASLCRTLRCCPVALRLGGFCFWRTASQRDLAWPSCPPCSCRVASARLKASQAGAPSRAAAAAAVRARHAAPAGAPGAEKRQHAARARCSASLTGAAAAAQHRGTAGTEAQKCSCSSRGPGRWRRPQQQQRAGRRRQLAQRLARCGGLRSSFPKSHLQRCASSCSSVASSGTSCRHNRSIGASGSVLTNNAHAGALQRRRQELAAVSSQCSRQLLLLPPPQHVSRRRSHNRRRSSQGSRSLALAGLAASLSSRHVRKLPTC